jgi:hypothetical protein
MQVSAWLGEHWAALTAAAASVLGAAVLAALGWRWRRGQQAPGCGMEWNGIDGMACIRS